MNGEKKKINLGCTSTSYVEDCIISGLFSLIYRYKLAKIAADVRNVFLFIVTNIETIVVFFLYFCSNKSLFNVYFLFIKSQH